MRRLLLLVAAIAVVTGCGYAPTTDGMARASDALTAVLPTLGGLGVTTFRDQDWCHNIEYRAGFFSSELTDATACNLATAEPQPFDGAADADWQRVHEALAATGMTVPIVDAVTLGDATEVIVARFYIDAGPLGGSTFYLYDPQSTWSHQSDPGELEFTPVDDAWWFGWEDWN